MAHLLMACNGNGMDDEDDPVTTKLRQAARAAVHAHGGPDASRSWDDAVRQADIRLKPGDLGDAEQSAGDDGAIPAWQDVPTPDRDFWLGVAVGMPCVLERAMPGWSKQWHVELLWKGSRDRRFRVHHALARLMAHGLRALEEAMEVRQAARGRGVASPNPVLAEKVTAASEKRKNWLRTRGDLLRAQADDGKGTEGGRGAVGALDSDASGDDRAAL